VHGAHVRMHGHDAAGEREEGRNGVVSAAENRGVALQRVVDQRNGGRVHEDQDAEIVEDYEVEVVGFGVRH